MLVLRIHSFWPSTTMKETSREDEEGGGLRLGCPTGPSAEGAEGLPGGGPMADHAW